MDAVKQHVLRGRALELRHNRATALMLAAISFRGDNFDTEQLLGLADEFLDYIEGDDFAPIPRPDLTGDVIIPEAKKK